jgi:predicted transcriptional regulator
MRRPSKVDLSDPDLLRRYKHSQRRNHRAARRFPAHCAISPGHIGLILTLFRKSPYALCVTLKAMEVHFTPEQEAQLAQIATKEGTDAERLVKDAALRLLEEDARFRAAVREGIAQADRGEFIEEAEMDARLEQMLRS